MIRILDPEPHSAALNMALDEALLLLAPKSSLRIYRWARAAISFGYFGRYAAVAEAWPQHALVRRMTGGGAVPHGEDITYTITAPAGHPLARRTARESYREIHGTIAHWLTTRGLESQLAAATPDRGNGICFESPVESDVVIDGRKLAGAAQRRTREGLLVQGSIQGIAMDWAEDLASVFGCVASRCFTKEERALADRLAEEKYSTDEWLHRV